MTAVLSIGTTHPWNIAGVGLDIQVGRELGARVLSVVTAISAQDENGVHALETLGGDIVRAQIAALPMGEIAGMRIGALTSVETVSIVSELARSETNVPVVLDPVLAATRGGTFADDPTFDAIRRELLVLPNVVVTPNTREAAALLGRRAIDRDGMAEAARALQALGSRAALVTGGHLEGNPVDALATRDAIELFGGTRIPRDMRGSGCVLAMALAVELADRHDLRSAVQHARVFVRKKIETARQFGDLFVAY
jgi:hydroxymethylpyrimidine/phosphomethylpyrimidine kinase